MARQTSEIFPKTFEIVILVYYYYSPPLEKMFHRFVIKQHLQISTQGCVMYYACILYNHLLLRQNPPGGVTHLQSHCLPLNIPFSDGVEGVE